MISRRVVRLGLALLLLGALGQPPSAVEVRKIRPEQPADHTLEREVGSRLVGRPGLDPREISISVKEARLTLAGEVSSLFERSEAERLSSAVRGLISIRNEIVVRDIEIPDSLLELKAMRGLEASPRLRSFRLEVRVEDGALTITGQVPLARDRLEAEKLASRVNGIHSLDNRITLTPAPVDPEIIVRRLKSLLSNKLIFGGVDGLEVEASAEGVVTLRGIAVAHVDRLRAERIAYGLQGVTAVRNSILVRVGASPDP